MQDIFDAAVAAGMVARIQRLEPDSRAQWGRMAVGQMLAHCCVTYEMVFDGNHKKPNPLMRLLLKMFVKDAVVSGKPYKHNSATGGGFLIKDTRDFRTEKERLITYIQRTQQLGAAWFDGRESLSFGPLDRQEWNNMFYTHLDHHLRQFGV